MVELEVDTVGHEREESGNKEERDAEPSTTTSIVKDTPRSFVPKTPYPERLQAPKKGGKYMYIFNLDQHKSRFNTGDQKFGDGLPIAGWS